MPDGHKMPFIKLSWTPTKGAVTPAIIWTIAIVWTNHWLINGLYCTKRAHLFTLVTVIGPTIAITMQEMVYTIVHAIARDGWINRMCVWTIKPSNNTVSISVKLALCFVGLFVAVNVLHSGGKISQIRQTRHVHTSADRTPCRESCLAQQYYSHLVFQCPPSLCCLHI